jgi:hypothetical protein
LFGDENGSEDESVAERAEAPQPAAVARGCAANADGSEPAWNLLPSYVRTCVLW